MAGKHVETFALKLGKKCPKNGNILWGPGNGCDVSGWCWEVYVSLIWEDWVGPKGSRALGDPKKGPILE